MAYSPTQMLEDEHLVIAKVVEAAPALADQLEAGKAVDADTLQGVADFMRTFADKCHHGKEEDLLFPMTNKVLDPDDQQALLQQFEQVEERLGRDVHQRLEQFAVMLAENTLVG